MAVTEGMVVRSKAGRDIGDWFVVLQCDGQYAYLANGELRKVDRPKKKKLKHLQPTEHVSEFIENKLQNGLRVTNQEVRKALSEYLDI